MKFLQFNLNFSKYLLEWEQPNLHIKFQDIQDLWQMLIPCQMHTINPKENN